MVKKKSPITQAAPLEKVDKREKTIWSIAIKRPVSISKLTPTTPALSHLTQKMQHQQSQSQHPQTAAVAPTESTAPEAPPKQVALAMDRLGQAGRLIADIRLGADRLLEALMIAGQSHHQLDKPLHLILKEEASMRQYLQELRSIGTSFSSLFFFLHFLN